MYDIVVVHRTQDRQSTILVHQSKEIKDKVALLCASAGWDPKTVVYYEIIGQTGDI